MWDTAALSAMTHGTSGLALAYASVELPLLAALRHRHASLDRWLRAPLVGVPATLAAGLGVAALGAGLQSLGFGSEALITSFGLGIHAGTGYLAGRLLARPQPSGTVHRRGALVEDSPIAARAGSPPSATLAREAEPRLPERAPSRGGGRRTSTLTLAGHPLSLEDETKHFKIIGTTGTGKSTAIREILAAALARGDRAIIADPDGGYLARFHDAARGDVILNPFEPRARRWDLFAEMTTPYDVEQLTRSLISDPAGSDRSWTTYARTFFTAVTRQAQAQGVRDVGELYRLLVVAPIDELRTLVTGTPAQPFLEEQNTRMFDSIRSVTSSAVGALEYVAQQDGAPLSVREWVRRGAQGERRGVLYIPYRAGQIAALRSTISAWMRLGIFEAMDQPEGDQRLWFVVDELDALGPIDGLKDALARLRKFGGRTILGLQSIAQVSSLYGRDAQTIVENTGNTLILRSSGSEHGGTSQFASRLIGQREVLRTTQSRSQRYGEFFSSISHSQHVQLEPAVLDAEVEQLADLEGYLKIASVPSWRRVRLTPDARMERAATENRHATLESSAARSAKSRAPTLER